MKKFNALTMLACLALPLVACTNAAPAAPTLTGIELTSLPTKVNYYTGEQISLEGLEVTAQYSNKSTKVVTDYTTNASSVDMSTAGEKSVKVTYKEFDKSFTVSVAKATKTAWTAAEKALIEQYAGEELPVPQGLLADAVVEEVEGEEFDWETFDLIGNGEFHLEIYDESESFTIENYYQQLAAAGWTISVDDEDSPALIDDYGDVYYQANKKDGLKIYSVQYYYDEGNFIYIDSTTLTDQLTSSTEWSEEDLYYFSNIAYVPTFFKAGSDYYVSGEDVYVAIFDSYYQDNSEAFYDALEADGFTFNEDAFCHQKTDENGNIYSGLAFFDEMKGNTYYISVQLDIKNSTSWPSAALTDFASNNLVTISAYTSGTEYDYYVLGDQVYIKATASDEDAFYTWFNLAYSAYLSQGLNFSQDEGDVAYIYSFLNWEETFMISIEPVYEVEETEDSYEYTFLGATFTFSENLEPAELLADFPAEAAIEYLELDESVEIPTVTDVAGKGYKYFESLYLTDDWDIIPYVAICVYDTGTPGEDAIEDTYLAQLKAAGWYVDESQYADSGYLAENEDGSVLLTFYNEANRFVLFVEEGSGQSHGGGGDIPVDENADVLTQATFGLTDGDSSYGEHTSTGTAGTYTAQCASQHGVQIRSKNSNSGIVGSNNGKTIKSITFVFDENTVSGRTVDIYASNSEFGISDMYGGTMTKVGSVSYDGTNATVTYTFTGDYTYFGIRSHDGAIFFTSISVSWN